MANVKGRRFTAFMQDVDAKLYEITLCTSIDLPDFDYWSWWHDGMSVDDIVDAVIEWSGGF